MSITRIVSNRDNEELLPWGGRGVVIGSVDEVNGSGAEEIPDFVPTRHELLQLVNFWVKEALDYEFNDVFLFASHSSSGSRRMAYAWRRINRIGELLGEERVKGAVEEAYAEFGKSFDQRHWEIFLHGSSEDWEALQDEIHRKIQDDFTSREESEQ